MLKVASWHLCGLLLQPPGAGDRNWQGLPVVCANGVPGLLSSAPPVTEVAGVIASRLSLQPRDRTRPSEPSSALGVFLGSPWDHAG